MNRTLITTFAILSSLTVIALFGLRTCENAVVRVVDDGLDKLGALVTGVLGIAPQQTSQNVLIVQGTKEVHQHVFLEDLQYGEKHVKNKWLGSEKEYHLWAKHRVKIGVDLDSDQFRFEIQNTQDGDRTIFINYPKPQVLSTEVTDFDIKTADGSWNVVHDEERVSALKALKDEAIAAAKREENLVKAAKCFEDHFTALVSAIDPKAKIIYNSPFKASAGLMP